MSHRRPLRPLSGLVVALVVLAACAAHGPTSDAVRDGAAARVDPDALTRSALADQVARIAADYRTWGALDQPLRLAPTLCRRPPAGGDPTTRRSEAEDGAHGKKLYRLYARDPAAYRGVESGAPQAHQVLVKEAFEAVPFEMPGPGSVPPDVVITTDGLFRAGAPAGLFVMHRGPEPGEDERLWTYATVDPAGEVEAVGRLESCVRCHAEAPYGGLFGLDR